MKIRNLIAGNVILGLLATSSVLAADQVTKLHGKPGSKMRIEGTSTIHDWQVESKIIGGSIEVGPNFPVEAGQDVKPGKVDAQANAYIPVRSLLSVNKDGSHYDDKMDDTMWKNLKVTEFPKIVYTTSELVLKEIPKSKEEPYVFDSKGELAIGGVTNKISMPVKVFPLGGKNLKITGTFPTKMSDFNIKAEKIGLGFVSFKTADDVKLLFEWMVGPPKPVAAANP